MNCFDGTAPRGAESEGEMKVIRDEETWGLMMIPLLVDWGVRRCNVKDCTARPTTIISGAHPEASLFGLCEAHYQESKKSGQFKFTLIFDDFDAFQQKEAQT